MSTPAPSQRLGPYELIEQIGKGGMGEVWRARDPRLGRDVAIKISAQQFTDRFEREARTVASLNHTNICHLYDVGPNYLVMELIEGPTLAERIAQGAIPLEESIRIADQIADAVEAAHEKGIVHRDLKPGNIKLRPDGSVKVLDFGLAKPGAESAVTSDSPTMLSVSGVILGTAGYMSPEQARGKSVDKRADIWAFGVIVYEMVTGQHLFEGETVSDTLAAVLTREPDLANVPARLQPLLRRCLRKDPNQRLRDISGVELLLEQEPHAVPAQTRPANNVAKLGWIMAAVLFLACAGLGYRIWQRAASPPAHIVRFELPLDEAQDFGGLGPNRPLAISPDGKHIAFSAALNGRVQLFVRELDSTAVRALPFTGRPSQPFWAPDSHNLAFFDFESRKLNRIDIYGGPALTICDVAREVRGGTWSDAEGGVILFATNEEGIFRVAPSGGKPSLLVKSPQLQRGRSESDGWPWFLPDGRHFVFTARTGPSEGTVRVSDLGGGAGKVVAQTSSNAVYADGELLFVRTGNLVAQPFDVSNSRTTGEPAVVVQAVLENQVTGIGFFSSSQNGILTWYPGGEESNLQLSWFDRSGKPLGTLGPVSRIREWAMVSPDGSKVATGIGEFLNGPADVWIYDLARGAASRFTFGPLQNYYPFWSPDGTRIGFSSMRDGVEHGYVKALNGGTESVLTTPVGEPPHFTLPEDWSPDGRSIVERLVATSATADDLWIQPLGPDGLPGNNKPFPYLQSQFNERNASISPDGKWCAYTSDETGRYEVYVQSFPAPERKIQISADGGDRARWSRDGKEIFFIGAGSKMMAVPIHAGASIDAGKPAALFDTRIGKGFNNRFDVTKDGRFLIPVQPQGSSASALTVLVNWTASLKR